MLIVLIPDLGASSVITQEDILFSGTDTKLFRGKEPSCLQLTLKWFKQKNNVYMNMYMYTCTMYRKEGRGEGTG